ncbi:hypothetical protein GCHA_4738 [Paraglaciecola chathamensis S18K6]|uniref:Uncharacterized protein n=1 Tax=Paraglaciecola chathamensis S18K6 TaxID=1127672 RepID=A0AAV3V8A4_9ALTE|nr:hypothetical protein GCHA_4738 [Paraglaciecola chathamensis S18K6]
MGSFQVFSCNLQHIVWLVAKPRFFTLAVWGGFRRSVVIYNTLLGELPNLDIFDW